MGTNLGRLIFAVVGILPFAGCEDGDLPRPPEPVTPVAAGDAAAGPAWFADVTAARKFAFRHDTGPFGDYFMPDSAGSGGAVLDFDNDGRLDILMVQITGPGTGKTHALFHQQPDGTFADVTEGSGLDVDGHGMGAACGDVNNDGLVDVAITYYRGTRLFINTGNGRFVQLGDEAGVVNPYWGMTAAFFDYDRDGRLDLFVANYIAYQGVPCFYQNGQDFCGPGEHTGSDAKLYRNTTPPGDASPAAVRFEDVTERAGIAGRPGAGLGVVCADFTADGWQDVFVTNDGEPNFLWVNRRDGTFAEEGVVRGVAVNAAGKAQANMGIGVGDADGNGLLDLYVTHLTEEGNVLWAQDAAGAFRDLTRAVDLTRIDSRGTGFGTTMTDFDNDADPDIAIVNGRVSRSRLYTPDPATVERLGPWAPYAERNIVLRNDGGRFVDTSPAHPAFAGRPNVGRGLVVADLDNDGGMDLIACQADQPAQVFRNVAPARGHWVLVRAVDPARGGRDAYGASVTVTAAGRQYGHVVAPSYSYLNSNDPRLHFGLGAASVVDRVTVTWPDGTAEAFPGGPVDRVMVVSKGAGQPVATAAADAARR